MGIYIPGMEMPTSCYKCPVNKDDGFGYFTCGVTHSECDFKDFPADCPIIPVPDHGRLIDADEAIGHLFIGEQCLYSWDEIEGAIDATETIIPASTADKEGE